MQTVHAYPRLAASVEAAPIVRKGDYDYFVHPLSDGIPRVEPEVLREATRGIVRHLDAVIDDIDVLVTAEAMGLPIATAVSLQTDVPFVTVRKRSYGLPGERALEQTTGYGSSRLYLNGVERGDRVAIIDDVISTGGTLRALTGGLAAVGAPLVGVVSVFSKDPDLSAWTARVGCPVSALLACRVSTGPTGPRVVVTGSDIGLR